MDRIPRHDTFGARLRYWRKRRKLTQAAFAARVGIAQPSVSEMESGETKEPSAPVLLKAAEVLMLNPKYLLTGEGPEESFSYATLAPEEQQLIITLRSVGPDALREHLNEANKQYAFTSKDALKANGTRG